MIASRTYFLLTTKKVAFTRPISSDDYVMLGTKRFDLCRFPVAAKPLYAHLDKGVEA